MAGTQGIQFLFELANGQQTKPANSYVGLFTEAEDQIATNAETSKEDERTGFSCLPA